MSSLEDKLIELGYKKTAYGNWLKYQNDNGYFVFEIEKSKNLKGMVRCGMSIWFKTQQDIDNLQQAFNEMNKDLEILKDIDKPTQKNDIGNDLWEKDVKHMQKLGEWERKQWNY